MSIPERIWRVLRGRWLLAEEQLRDAMADEAAARELAEIRPLPAEDERGVPRISGRARPAAQAGSLRPPHDPLAADLAFLGAPPACDIETLDRIYHERLAELDREKSENKLLDPGVDAARRTALSEAYERLRDAINTTETRFEKLEF
jgi:hypothetical protein